MKAMVLASGGVDSSTALAMAVEKYGRENVYALSISYGQKHDREIEAAKKIAKHYGVKQRFLDLSLIFKDSSSSLIREGQEIPKGSYAMQKEESVDKESSDVADSVGSNLISTYVPFRNGLFLASAASIAQSLGCGVIYYGAHADDATGAAYPDCTPEFNEAMNKSITLGTGGEVRIEAPFVNITKADIVKKGLELNVPYEYTWSCYEGGSKPCGVCATCIDRAKAFEKNGVRDPATDFLESSMP